MAEWLWIKLVLHWNLTVIYQQIVSNLTTLAIILQEDLNAVWKIIGNGKMFLIKTIVYCNEEPFFACTLVYLPSVDFHNDCNKNLLLDSVDTKLIHVQACTYAQTQNTCILVKLSTFHAYINLNLVCSNFCWHKYRTLGTHARHLL